jgi:hypothetical protein
MNIYKNLSVPKSIHCGKQASPANIKRWHDDNCKLNPA